MHPPDMQLSFVLNESKMIICRVLSCQKKTKTHHNMCWTPLIFIDCCLMSDHYFSFIHDEVHMNGVRSTLYSKDIQNTLLYTYHYLVQ
jgi:hypothetical protein